MRPLTKEAEAKLISAIERAASYVNAGLTPNAAIIKSASESDVPAGHINLMVHAYNTGRTTKQREQGESTLEKAADFPLADADTVMDALFPKAVKTSAELSSAHAVSADYAVSPAGMLARRKAAQSKEAAAKISLPEKTWVPPPRDEEAAVRRAASEKRAAELAQEELRRQATAAYSKAAAAMEELHEYFRRPGNLSFQDAVRETELRYGEDGVNVLNKLAAVYPHLTKQAATKDVIIGDCQPCKLAAAVLSALEAYNEAQARAPAAKQAAAKKAEPAVVTGSILHNPADEPLVLKGAMAAGDRWGLVDPPRAGQEGAPRLGNKGTEVDPAAHADFVNRRPSPGDNFRLVMPDNKLGNPVWVHQDETMPEDEYDRMRSEQLAHEAANRAARQQQQRNSGSPLIPEDDELDYSDEGAEPDSFEDAGPAGGGPGGGGPGGGGSGGGGSGGGGRPSQPSRSGRRRRQGSRGGERESGGFSLAPVRSGFLSAAKAIASRMAQGAAEGEKKMKTKAYQSLTDPEHETALRNIRAQSMLHDLVLNDPVISGHDPTEVAQAFNELADVAPQFVDSPAAMQALLRKRLEAGQMADFDVKQLVDMEKSKADTAKAQMETKNLERQMI